MTNSIASSILPTSVAFRATIKIWMRLIIRWAVTLTIAMSLFGCGFHLRGSPALYGEEFSQGGYRFSTPLQINYPNSERAWASRLITQLSQAGIEVIDTTLESYTSAASEGDSQTNATQTAKPKYPTLNIIESNKNRRIASYTSRAKAAEYTLTESLSYQISSPSGELITPKITLSSDRVYEFNVNNISGKDQEANLISEELQMDIAQKLIRHLYKIQQQIH